MAHSWIFKNFIQSVNLCILTGEFCSYMFFLCLLIYWSFFLPSSFFYLSHFFPMLSFFSLPQKFFIILFSSPHYWLCKIASQVNWLATGLVFEIATHGPKRGWGGIWLFWKESDWQVMGEEVGSWGSHEWCILYKCEIKMSDGNWKKGKWECEINEGLKIEPEKTRKRNWTKGK